MTLLTVGSLFAGIGGLELGLEQTGGFKTIWSVENDEYCNRVRKRHWPTVPQYNDIRDFPPSDGIERPDLICGGSPCQDLSCAGKQVGISGGRSSLFFEMVRVIRILRPRWVVWENVRGALSSNGGDDFRAVLGAISNAGYDAEWVTLRASDFGYPHRRERVFLVAYMQGQLQKRAARERSETREGIGRRGEELAYPIGQRGCGWNGERENAAHVYASGESVADAWGQRLQGDHKAGTAARAAGRGGGAVVGDAELTRREESQPSKSVLNFNKRCARIYSSPPGPNDLERWAEILAVAPWLAPAIEPGFRGVADGLSPLLDLPGVEIQVDDERRKRLKALGNAVVPACARWIGERILEAKQ